MLQVSNGLLSVEQNLQGYWKECEDDISACLYFGEPISQELLLRAWKCFDDYPRCFDENAHLCGMVIIKSNPETFRGLKMTQPTFDRVYMAAFKANIIQSISKCDATPLMPCGGVQAPLALTAMRSEYFRVKFSTKWPTELSSGKIDIDVPENVFKLWNSFVRTNEIPNEATDLLDALFFAHQIMCHSFLVKIANRLWDVAIVPNLSWISTTFEKATINTPQVKKQALFIQAPSRVNSKEAKSHVRFVTKQVSDVEQLATFEPKQILDLKKMGGNFKTWNMSSLAPIKNSDERNSMMEEMLAVIFHLLDPKNTLSVETLVLTHNVITFFYTFSEEEVKECLRKFPNVTKLDLSNTSFESRPDLFEWIISTFPNIKELNLSECCFSSKVLAFPALKKASELEILNLHGAKNPLKILLSLVDLKKLRFLNIKNSISDYRFLPKELFKIENLKISLSNPDLNNDSPLYGCNFPDSILFQAVAYQNLDDIFWILKNHANEASYKEKESRLGLMQCLLRDQNHYDVTKLMICDILAEVTPQSIFERDGKGLTPLHYLIATISGIIRANNNVENFIIMAQKWLELAKARAEAVF